MYNDVGGVCTQTLFCNPDVLIDDVDKPPVAKGPSQYAAKRRIHRKVEVEFG